MNLAAELATVKTDLDLALESDDPRAEVKAVYDRLNGIRQENMAAGMRAKSRRNAAAFEACKKFVAEIDHVAVDVRAAWDLVK